MPATTERQAPTIKTAQGAVDVCQFQCLDRVVNVPVAIRQERSIALMCCSSCVPKNTADVHVVSQRQVSSTLRSSISTTISIAENTQISFPLRANPNDPVPVQHIDGIINVPVPQIPEQIVEAVKHIPQSRFSSALYYRSPPRVEDIGEVLPGRSVSSTVSLLGSTAKHLCPIWYSRGHPSLV